MASKVRAYAVHVLDGHGPRVDLVAAQSKKDLELQIEKQQLYSVHEKIERITPRGWATVQAQPTEANDSVEFCLAVGQTTFTVGPGEVGHSHLTRQCPDQVRAVEEFNDHINFGPGIL